MVTGAAIESYIADLARLRIAVFRDFPYLYDGSLGYEMPYLRRYARSPRSVVVFAVAGDIVVGASTAIPLADEDGAFRAPFESAGFDVATVCYGGESVLLPAYRGRGIYRQFFAQREAHARGVGAMRTFAFCAVQRSDTHPLRPPGYAPLDPIWRRYGYIEHPELVASLAWKDVGEPAESGKSLTFWLKPLAVSDARAFA